MKKSFLLGIGLSLCFTLAACGEQPNNTPVASSGIAASEASTNITPEPTAQMISEDLTVYQDALGNTCAAYVTEIKNTSSSAIALTNASIDIEKPDGTLLKSTDFFSVTPRVIAAGESAYISQDIINGLDEGITPDQIGKAILHYDVEARPDFEPLSVEISELSLLSEHQWPKFQGRIENKGTTDLKNIYIVAPIRDSNGNLQTVGLTIVDSLSAGEKKGFEQTCMSAPTNVDYSQSSLSAFACDGSLF